MKSINLLPQQHSSQHSPGRWLVVGQFILIGLAIIGLLLTLWWKREALVFANQAQAKRTEKERLRTELERANQLQLKLSTILDRRQAWTKLETTNPHYTELLQQLTAAIPPTVRLTNITSQNTKELVLTGIAVQRSDLATFITNLNQQSRLSNATLSQTNNQADGVQFSLTITPQIGKSSPQPAVSVSPTAASSSISPSPTSPEPRSTP